MCLCGSVTETAGRACVCSGERMGVCYVGSHVVTLSGVQGVSGGGKSCGTAVVRPCSPQFCRRSVVVDVES